MIRVDAPSVYSYREVEMEEHEALRALLTLGIRATPADVDTLTTTTGEVIRWGRTRRTPTPANVERELRQLLAGERLLYAVARATPALQAAAAKDPRLIIVSDDDRTVWADKTPHSLEEDTADAPSTVRKGPTPYGQFAVLRALITAAQPLTQRQLAAATGLTQPAVLNALRPQSDLIHREATGYVLTDPEGAWDRAIKVPQKGITTYWRSERPLAEQAQAVNTDALLSGDLAADRISGWRIPEHVTLYARAGVDLSRRRFALGSSDEYTLSLTIPADKTIWATSARAGRTGLADPIIVARDVLATGTTGDQAEAAEMLRRSALQPHTTQL
ncbi:MarR family transcriptional regulator [Curtobacterium sp. VKM Ac-1376]|uniref:MarR family transcriptional regulator n=1 Tax=Curtobacterium sp. VKM Ac-1376 TaxID=123312 RepID=UPI00188A21D0|nr:MarR family transcriptional regulator [Curtobacterium sp. VKM Ac-1376]MBF4616408.1 hypothetical protein [Curtobacterium sp. VKM Ac-1376]